MEESLSINIDVDKLMNMKIESGKKVKPIEPALAESEDEFKPLETPKTFMKRSNMDLTLYYNEKKMMTNIFKKHNQTK